MEVPRTADPDAQREARSVAPPGAVPPTETTRPAAKSRFRSPETPGVVGVAVVLLVVLGLVLFNRLQSDSASPGGSTDPEVAKVAQVAKTYLAARASGDGTLACRQLTNGARRGVVALATSNNRIRAASLADCARWVLKDMPGSVYAEPALKQAFDLRRFDPAVSVEAGVLGRVTPQGREQPWLEEIKEAGGWKIDALARPKLSFVMYCGREGGTPGRCGCIFDELRSLGFNSWPRVRPLFGGRPNAALRRGFDSASRACATAAGSGPLRQS